MRFNLLASSSITLLMSGVAYAQTSPGPATTAQPGPAAGQAESAPTQGITDIIVTAQRREQRLQDVPISVTALSGADLQKQQLTELKNLQGSVPGVFIGQAVGDPTDLAIGLRGIAQTTAQSVTDPTIGIYVDGVYHARTSGSNVGFIDMERVEVLRGPQGTLFGRNTIGGAFNITTNKPTDRLEGSISADAGNYGSKDVTAVLNAPLADQLAVRLVYAHLQHDGYGRNLYLNTPIDDAKQDYGRATLRYSPGNWDFQLSGDYSKFSSNPQAFKAFYFNPAAPANAAVPAANGHPGDLISNYVGKGGFHDNYSYLDARTNIRIYDITGTAAGHVGSVQVKSITGYRDERAERPIDLSGTPYPLITNPIKPFNYFQFSEELQAYGKGFDDRLDWIVGAYYFTENDRSGQETILLGNLAPAGIFGSEADTLAKNRSMGAFGQATFALSSKVKVTGGIRYTRDTREATYFDKRLPVSGVGPTLCGLTIVDGAGGLTTGQLGAPVTSACMLSTPKLKFGYVPFTFDIDYKPNRDTLLYAKVSRGYRSGGLIQAGNAVTNLAVAPAQLKGFGPENLLTEEIGSKIELFSRHLRLNTAGYVSQYKQIQQSTNYSVIVGGAPATATLTANIGDATIYGTEVEATALLGKLELHGALGYVHPRYTSGPSVTNPRTPFINFSSVTYDLGADLPVQTGIGTLLLSSNYTYQSSVLFFVPAVKNAATYAAATQNGYGLIGAHIDLTLRALPLTLSVYGRNLANKDYKTRAADFTSSPAALISGSVGDPRTFGGSATYRF